MMRISNLLGIDPCLEHSFLCSKFPILLKFIVWVFFRCHGSDAQCNIQAAITASTLRPRHPPDRVNSPFQTASFNNTIEDRALHLEVFLVLNSDGRGVG